MRRTYKFLLRPTTSQEARLRSMLSSHRELYNAALQERRDAWRMRRISISYNEQSAQLKYIRRLRPDVAEWSFHSQQGTLRRLDRAFRNFFRRVKRGDKPGYPRFKGEDRFDFVEWPSDGDGCRWKPEQHQVRLQGVGTVRVHAHRSVGGRLKTVAVKREGKRWYLLLSCDDVPARPLEPAGTAIGIDLGVVSFLTTSDGEHIENRRLLARSAGKLANAQRALAQKRPGSNRRRKARDTFARLHRRVRNARRDFHHKTALALVQAYDVICHEALAVRSMTRSAAGTVEKPGRNMAAKSGLNRSILDAGWAQFLAILRAKAECAGRQVVAVDPRRTSQTCSSCGHVSAGNRVTQAEFRCQACGREAHADVNAAVNVLRLGLSLRDGHVA